MTIMVDQYMKKYPTTNPHNQDNRTCKEKNLIELRLENLYRYIQNNLNTNRKNYQISVEVYQPLTKDLIICKKTGNPTYMDNSLTV